MLDCFGMLGPDGTGYIVFMEDDTPVWEVEFDLDQPRPDMNRLDLMGRACIARN